MQGSEWEVFLKEVLLHVKFKLDHKVIHQELLDHMEDRYEDFRKEGMGEEEARKAVLLCMGDAEEIGEEMNRAHNPVLGWIWWGLRWIVILLVLCNLFPLLQVAGSIGATMLDEYREFEDKTLMYSIPLEETIEFYDVTYFIDEIRYFSEGTLEVRYRTWKSPFSSSGKNADILEISVKDAQGERYDLGGYYKNAGLYYGRGGTRVNRIVPLDATAVILSDGGQTLGVIDITEGRVMAQ